MAQFTFSERRQDTGLSQMAMVFEILGFGLLATSGYHSIFSHSRRLIAMKSGEKRYARCVGRTISDATRRELKGIHQLSRSQSTADPSKQRSNYLSASRKAGQAEGEKGQQLAAQGSYNATTSLTTVFASLSQGNPCH